MDNIWKEAHDPSDTRCRERIRGVPDDRGCRYVVIPKGNHFGECVWVLLWEPPILTQARNLMSQDDKVSNMPVYQNRDVEDYMV